MKVQGFLSMYMAPRPCLLGIYQCSAHACCSNIVQFLFLLVVDEISNTIDLP